MADLKISQLTASTTPLAGTEVLPIVQSGVTKQVSVINLTAGRNVSALSTTVGAGTVSAPSITTSGNTNTGVFFPAADAIATTIAGVEITRSVNGRHGVGTTQPQQLFSVVGGGILQKAIANLATATPTEILRAAGFSSNSQGASIYKVNVIATFEGAASRVKEFIWIAQVFQTSGSRTFTQIYDYECNLNAGNRRLDFTVTASKTGNDEILTLDLSSSGTLAPTTANIVVYAEAYGGRAGFTAGRSHTLS